MWVVLSDQLGGGLGACIDMDEEEVALFGGEIVADTVVFVSSLGEVVLGKCIVEDGFAVFELAVSCLLFEESGEFGFGGGEVEMVEP